MAELATLSLAIDSRSAVEATSAIDKMGEAAARGEGRVKQILTATDSLVAALNRNATATAALTGRMDQMQAAGAKATDAIKAIGTSAGTAGNSVMDLASNLEKTGAAATTSARAIDASAASAQKHVSTTTQVSAATAKATAAHNDNAKAVGLSANELRNLSFQLNDVATMALSGASAFQIAATQGGQFLQIGQMAGGGIKGILTQAGEAAASLAGRIGIVGASLGAVTIGLATAAAAAASYRAEQKELERSTFGIGRASGATLQTLQDAALAGSAGGKISSSAARDVVGSLNATGKIDPKVYGEVAGNVGDLAKVLGTDVPTATETVTGALAGGVQGFDKLNATLGLGGAALREQIKDLYESGRAFEAQRIIVDAYGKRLAEVTEKPSWLQSTFGDFGRNTANELSAIGSVFRKRTPEENLTGARKSLANGQAQVDAGLAPASSLDAARANVEKLEASIAKTAQGSKEAKTALVSLTVQPLVESLNPAQKRVDDLRKSAESIDTFLKEGGDKLDQSGNARRTMDSLREQAKQLADDLARGGTALADGIRNAQYGLRSIGNSQAGQSLADVQKRAEDARLVLERQNPDPAVRAAQQASIEETRRLEEQRVRQETAYNAGNSGGAFSRAPANIQAMILDAVKQFPRVDPAILAAVGEKENSFKLTGATRVLNSQGLPSTTAYGYGQITDPAQTDIRKVLPGFDKTNPDTAVLGTAAYLDQRIRGAGNLVKGLDGYGTGPGYGTDILRRAGKLGDVSAEGQARDVDANAQALKQANDNLRLNTELYGRNGAQLEAQTRATEQYNQLLNRGVPAAEAASIAFSGLTDKLVAVERSGRSVLFARDDQFARDQVGRTRLDQQAYASARSRFGDTTSTEAQGAIETSRLTSGLSEARNTFSDVFGSVAQNLRKGADAATVASDALGRFADKLLSNAIDKVASGFGTALTGSASSGGILKLLGFDEGGYTGPGNRLQPAGIVHAGEVVWSQSDVARYGGPAVVNSMRQGLRGYADGGLAGWQPPAANVNQAPANIQIINNTPVRVDAQEVPDGRGGRRQEVVINEAVANGIRSPQGYDALRQPRLGIR